MYALVRAFGLYLISLVHDVIGCPYPFFSSRQGRGKLVFK